MTIAKRLIILLAVPLLSLIGVGIFTRLQLVDIETHMGSFEGPPPVVPVN